MQDQQQINETISVHQGTHQADRLRVNGELRIVITDRAGRVQCDLVTNLVVATGRNHIADQMSGKSDGQMSHMALGTSTTAADYSDTALGVEIARVAVTPAQGSAPNLNQVVYVGDFPPGTGTGVITEAGIFNAGSSGVMLCRSVFNAKDKGASDSMTITWTLTFSS
jgi:hypothetical protein